MGAGSRGCSCFSRQGSVIAIIFIIPWLCLLPILGMMSFQEGGIGIQVRGQLSGILPTEVSLSCLPLLHGPVTLTFDYRLDPSPMVTWLTCC